MENELPNPGRVPKENDLVALCRALNEHGARDLIVGGFAVIHHRSLRATEDIDVLLAGDLDNQARANAPLLPRMKQTQRKIAESSRPGG
jgi:hypothetical protein